jgi:hypothetical protein
MSGNPKVVDDDDDEEEILLKPMAGKDETIEIINEKEIKKINTFIKSKKSISKRSSKK